MTNFADPIKEALEVFMNIKKKVIDELGDESKEEVGLKFRTRAREVPEMILELGLVPTLTYCVAKASVENIVKVITVIELDSPVDKLKDIRTEDLAYALYTYALLKYIGIITGKFDVEDLVNINNTDASYRLLNYLEVLINDNIEAAVHKLLQPYLLQLKRLSEAVYKPER